MSRIWFTSDTHWGHANIVRYDGRPFTSIEEHDEALIERWNACVQSGDVVYHLGDVAFYKRVEQVEALLARLNGQKHHLYGNHDRDAVCRAKGWASQEHYRELKIDLGGERRQKIVLCHYPLMTWNGAHHGSWHLHGHCHGTLRGPATTRLDVGVPCHGYRPVSIESVQAIMASRTYLVVDQHQDRSAPDA